MPGEIESTAFLSQLEDMDKYLLEYRSLKLMPQVTNAFGTGMSHLRFSHGKEFDVGDSSLNGVGNNRKLQMANYGNGSGNTTNSGNANGRKKFMGKQQSFRMQSPTLKMPPQGNNKYAGSPLVNTHFKQAYPQMYYNPTNSNSSVSLGHSWQTQSSSEKAQLSSSNSSPSFVPPRVDSSLSGNSSSMASYEYSGGFDYVVPTSTDYGSQFSTVSGPFSSYLNSGVVPSGSSVGATSVTTEMAPASASSSSAMIGNLTGASFAPPSGSAGTSGLLAFDHSLANQAMPSSSVSASVGTTGLAGHSGAADLSSSNMGGDRLLMNDLSMGWGSNHASSAGAENYGIWNNDMSVWS